MSKRPYTLVEFRDRPEAANQTLHTTAHIYINGQEVLVQEDSVFIDHGRGHPTTVTLTLLPNEIRFNK